MMDLKELEIELQEFRKNKNKEKKNDQSMNIVLTALGWLLIGVAIGLLIPKIFPIQ